MRLEEFVHKVLKEVAVKAGSSLEVRTVPVEKNNGVMLAGIAASRPGRVRGACIYMDGYYEKYLAGEMNVSEVSEEVYRQFVEHCDDTDGIDLESLWHWEEAEPRIHAKLVNREMNRKLLEGVPHRDFLDLAVIYHVTVNGLPEGGTGSYTVSDRNMEIWGQDEESLYQTAVLNMRLSGEPVFESMEETFRKMMPGLQLPFPGSVLPAGMYVLTNQAQIFGAAELLDRGTLKWISDELGGDFVVLPSSIHETIIIRKNRTTCYQELADMVAGINRDAVSREERLSDHVYLYKCDKGTLEPVA